MTYCCSILFSFTRNIKKHFTFFWTWCLISDDCRSCSKVCGLLGFFILSMRLSYFVQTNATAKRKVQQGEQVRYQDPCDWSSSLLLKKTVAGTLHFSGTHAFKSKIIQILKCQSSGQSWCAFPSFSIFSHPFSMRFYHLLRWSQWWRQAFPPNEDGTPEDKISTDGMPWKLADRMDWAPRTSWKVTTFFSSNGYGSKWKT